MWKSILGVVLALLGLTLVGNALYWQLSEIPGLRRDLDLQVSRLAGLESGEPIALAEEPISFRSGELLLGEIDYAERSVQEQRQFLAEGELARNLSAALGLGTLVIGVLLLRSRRRGGVAPPTSA